MLSFYAQVSSSALESSLLKYSAKEYYFRASLCHLCVDVLNADHAIKKYADLFPAFADSRECKFVKVSGLGWAAILALAVCSRDKAFFLLLIKILLLIERDCVLCVLDLHHGTAVFGREDIFLVCA